MNFLTNLILITLPWILCIIKNVANTQSCDVKYFFPNFAQPKVCEITDFYTIYIFYDINSVEGFNLRRDVYIRMAVFVHNLKTKHKFRKVKLVLPPFPRLYHWKSTNIDQNLVLWSEFFDIESLRIFAPILDFNEFIMETRSTLTSGIKIHDVIHLQHFEEILANGIFIEKFEFNKCQKLDYPKKLLGYENITFNNFSCLKFQGSSSLLEDVIKVLYKKFLCLTSVSILFLNTEIILHDHWGSKQFWEARRSMRFNSNLVRIANLYRHKIFNSIDKVDSVQRPTDWRNEKKYRSAKGGNYICGHIRRADFLYGREKTTPSLKSIASQIYSKSKELKLSKVFISSDCSTFEFKTLKSYLSRIKVYKFTPQNLEEKNQIKDGGQAIIDQLICAHSRYFIGTYESTFTYRIYEEREILGFPIETTFNTFCKNEDFSDCEKNSIWPIVF